MSAGADRNPCPGMNPAALPLSDAIAGLDRLQAAAAEALFLQVSHSAYWTTRMLARRPFSNAAALSAAAAESWDGAEESDWLEAFAGHPEIGDVEHLRKRFDARALREQGQVLVADPATLDALARLNQDYRARHGFIFIIRAAGLSAEHMLLALRARIDRSRDTELAEAARQHASITWLRLEAALLAAGQDSAEPGAP